MYHFKTTTMQNVIHLKIQHAGDKIKEKNRPHEIATKVMQAANEVFGIRSEDIKRKTRKQPIVQARQMCMWYLKSKRLTMVKIAQLMGGFDHTTVIHSCQTVDNRASFEPDYRKLLSMFVNSIEIRLLTNKNDI